MTQKLTPHKPFAKELMTPIAVQLPQILDFLPKNEFGSPIIEDPQLRDEVLLAGEKHSEILYQRYLMLATHYGISTKHKTKEQILISILYCLTKDLLPGFSWRPKKLRTNGKYVSKDHGRPIEWSLRRQYELIKQIEGAKDSDKRGWQKRAIMKVFNLHEYSREIDYYNSKLSEARRNPDIKNLLTLSDAEVMRILDDKEKQR